MTSLSRTAWHAGSISWAAFFGALGAFAWAAATPCSGQTATNAVDPAFPAADVDATRFAVQSDGGILVVIGESGLIRLTPTGASDQTFQYFSGGIAISSVVATPTGGAYLLGSSGTVRRVTATGAVDATYACTLQIATLIGLQDTNLIAVTSDGALVRIKPDGSRDASFAAALPTDSDQPIVVLRGTIQPNGSILLLYRERDFQLVKTWLIGRDGATGPTPPFPANVVDAVLLPDGRWVISTIVVTGAGYGGVWPLSGSVQRLLADGSPDPTFTSFTYTTSGSLQGRTRLDVLADGRILVFGDVPATVDVSPTQSLSLDRAFRLLADGRLDATFVTRFLNGHASYSAETFDFPDATHAIVQRYGRLYRVALDATTAPPPEIVSVSPSSVAAKAGDSLSFSVNVTGVGPISLSWNPWTTTDDVPAPVLTLGNVQRETAPTALYAHGPTGTAHVPVTINVAPSAPHLLTEPPTSVVASVGRTVVLPFEAYGSEPVQWTVTKDGQPATNAQPTGNPFVGRGFTTAALTAADFGTYTLRVQNDLGAIERSIEVVAAPHSELSNVSARAWTAPGDATLTLGLSVTGAKQLWTGTTGSSLRRYGILEPLDDPTLAFRPLVGAPLTNDNTPFTGILRNVTYYERTSAVLPLTPSLDAEIATTISTGATIQASGAHASSGVVLVNVYDADDAMARIRTISARALVGPGERALIVGFVVLGDKAKRLLIRSVGPGLVPFGVSQPLADPRLRIVDMSNGQTMAENDDWSSAPGNESAVAAATSSVSTFPLVKGAKDAALVLTFDPGVYTVVTEAPATTAGIALIEVYEIE